MREENTYYALKTYNQLALLWFTFKLLNWSVSSDTEKQTIKLGSICFWILLIENIWPKIVLYENHAMKETCFHHIQQKFQMAVSTFVFRVRLHFKLSDLFVGDSAQTFPYHSQTTKCSTEKACPRLCPRPFLNLNTNMCMDHTGLSDAGRTMELVNKVKNIDHSRVCVHRTFGKNSFMCSGRGENRTSCTRLTLKVSVCPSQLWLYRHRAERGRAPSTTK